MKSQELTAFEEGAEHKKRNKILENIEQHHVANPQMMSTNQ
jgi:hypothetical protein